MPEHVRIDDYLRVGEAFHFDRIAISPGGSTPKHDHDCYEMILVEDGAGFHRMNGNDYELSKGDVIFIRPEDTHCFTAKVEKGCRLISILFRQETANELLARYPDELSKRFFWSVGPVPSTIHLVGAQHERAINTSGSMRTTIRTQLRLEHFLLTMMTFVLDDVARIDPKAPSWLIDACIAAQSPDVFRRGGAGLIEAARRGPEHVSRQTKRYLGVTPTQFVNRIRIQHTAMLLRKGAWTLPEIAEDAGFETLSYFHRLFREQYGCTPDSYRRRHQVWRTN